MTKICCLSDTHGDHYRLNEWFSKNHGDIVIFAGDYQYNSYDTGVDFLHWFESLPYSHKVMTFGNHDCNYEYVEERAEKYGVIVLNHEYVTIGGINIFGSPYTPPYGNWSFMENEMQLKHLYDQVSDDTNILVTHGPAFGVGDETEDGILTGSMSLSNRISELKNLKYHIFGHIHNQYGWHGNKSVNVSLLDNDYDLVHLPIVFEY